MGYKCLIVDDEPLAINVLESYIQIVPGLTLVAACSNALEATEVLRKIPVDILFLDIKMPQLSGTEFLRTLKNPPKVVFTTAYKDFAVEAFDLDAIDYLMKPISLERFMKAVNKVDGKSDLKANSDKKSSAIPPFLYFRTDRKMVKVLLDEIIYVESLKDYIRIMRKGAVQLVVKQSISSLEEMLPKSKFLRVHRSFIVSIPKVSSFTQQAIQIEGHEIPIGRAYQDQLKNLYNSA